MRREHLAVILTLLAVAAVPLATWWYQSACLPSLYPPGARVFHLTGFAPSGVWTAEPVRGVDYWWKRYQPATIFVNKGDFVIIELTSADMSHYFYVPGLGVGPVTVKVGESATVRFTADRPGTFEYFCMTLCGECHFYMRGWIVVTPAGEAPVVPPPITCPLDGRAGREEPPAGGGLAVLGEYLYRHRSCVSCHGPEGKGGVANVNYIQGKVPNHDTTAEKFFLQSREDTEAFTAMLERDEDLEARLSSPPFPNYALVLTRYRMAYDLIRLGKPSAKLDPAGPEPPLVMPSWGNILSHRDINSLLAYFISLQAWEDEEAEDGEE